MKKRILVLICFSLLLMLLTACGEITVNWVDADGTVIAVEEIEKDGTVIERPLPDDNDEWQYTSWRVIETDKQTLTYMAERIAKTRITWLDVDGTVLNKASIGQGEEVPIYGLPNDTDEWQYIRWEETEGTDGERIFRAVRIPKIRVIWQDYNGVRLYEKIITANATVPERALPEDVDGWHYTGWREQHPTDTQILFVAEREPVKTVIWRDGDGKQIYKQWVPLDAELPTRQLPINDSKWLYTEWVSTQSGNVYTCTAKGEPNPAYFVGNVFQIVGKNLGEAPIGLGSGFVLNEKGWFITNYHVLENAYAASAIFEVRNPSDGSSYTTLEISKIAYFDKDKDILIGKIDNYSKIASYYKSITFNTKYTVGDVTYSVGYPGGTSRMEVNKGEVLKSVSTVWNKLYGGNGYIASSSYITNGSSGGILINDRMEVIGITAASITDNEEFLGSSIEAYNFVSLIGKHTVDKQLKDMALSLHQDEKTFINFFRALVEDPDNYKKIESEAGFYYLSEYEWTEPDIGYYEKYQLYVYPDGSMICAERIQWASGNVMEELFAGVYSEEEGLDNFGYVMMMQHPDGDFYYVKSDDVNYSSNSYKQCLSNYEAYASYGSIDPVHLDYARRTFSGTYSFVKGRMEQALKK